MILKLLILFQPAKFRPFISCPPTIFIFHDSQLPPIFTKLHCINPLLITTNDITFGCYRLCCYYRCCYHYRQDFCNPPWESFMTWQKILFGKFYHIFLLPNTITKVLISRDYRGDLPWNSIDKFFPLVIDAEEEGNPSPIVQADDVRNSISIILLLHITIPRFKY